MTVEEAIQQAEAGDVVTMLDLGNYYSKKHDYVKAIKWYQKASDTGNLFGTLRTAYCNEYIMRLLMLQKNWDLSIGIFKDLVNQINILHQNPDFLEKEYLESLRTEPDNESTYGAEASKLYLAAYLHNIECNHMLSRYDYVIDKTEGIKDIDADLLVVRALALRDSVPDCAPIDDHIEASYKCFDILDKIIPTGYAVRDFYLDQICCAEAVFFYVSSLATGWNRNDKKNIDKAYKILTMWYERLTDKDAKAILSEQLSHFHTKKGLFGTSIAYSK